MSCMNNLSNILPCKFQVLLQVEYLVLDVNSWTNTTNYTHEGGRVGLSKFYNFHFNIIETFFLLVTMCKSNDYEVKSICLKWLTMFNSIKIKIKYIHFDFKN
jgi:hypothetical protein